MANRTFTTAPYRDTRVKRPDFPLVEALGWYFADAEIEPTTLKSYRSRLTRFCEWLPENKRVLGSLEPETYSRWARSTSTNQNTRMNKIVAGKSFARYLCEQKLWYGGTTDHRMSVLAELKQPQPSERGTPSFTDQEARAVVRAVNEGPNRQRNVAIVMVLLHGFRAKEARELLRRNVIVSAHRETGHLIIDDETQTKRGTHGIREVPMEETGKDAIRDYLRVRPVFRGDEPETEPLFLTDDGRPFTAEGWTSMAARLTRIVERETGIAFKQHRCRSTSVRQKHEAGWPDTANMEVHGWGANGWKMLRRYRGTIPVSQLKRYPMALDRVLRAG